MSLFYTYMYLFMRMYARNAYINISTIALVIASTWSLECLQAIFNYSFCKFTNILLRVTESEIYSYVYAYWSFPVKYKTAQPI